MSSPNTSAVLRAEIRSSNSPTRTVQQFLQLIIITTVIMIITITIWCSDSMLSTYMTV